LPASLLLYFLTHPTLSATEGYGPWKQERVIPVSSCKDLFERILSLRNYLLLYQCAGLLTPPFLYCEGTCKHVVCVFRICLVALTSLHAHSNLQMTPRTKALYFDESPSRYAVCCLLRYIERSAACRVLFGRESVCVHLYACSCVCVCACVCVCYL